MGHYQNCTTFNKQNNVVVIDDIDTLSKAIQLFPNSPTIRDACRTCCQTVLKNDFDSLIESAPSDTYEALKRYELLQLDGDTTITTIINKALEKIKISKDIVQSTYSRANSKSTVLDKKIFLWFFIASHTLGNEKTNAEEQANALLCRFKADLFTRVADTCMSSVYAALELLDIGVLAKVATDIQKLKICLGALTAHKRVCARVFKKLDLNDYAAIEHKMKAERKKLKKTPELIEALKNTLDLLHGGLVRAKFYSCVNDSPHAAENLLTKNAKRCIGGDVQYLTSLLHQSKNHHAENANRLRNIAVKIIDIAVERLGTMKKSTMKKDKARDSLIKMVQETLATKPDFIKAFSQSEDANQRYAFLEKCAINLKGVVTRKSQKVQIDIKQYSGNAILKPILEEKQYFMGSKNENSYSHPKMKPEQRGRGVKQKTDPSFNEGSKKTIGLAKNRTPPVNGNNYDPPPSYRSVMK